MCTFDEDGVYQADFLFDGFYKDGENGWMYFQANEAMNGWIRIGDNWHYFLKDHAAVGTVKIDGLSYKFEARRARASAPGRRPSTAGASITPTAIT